MNADDRCALRYAVGISLCAALAYGANWTMAYMAPILAAAFLGNRAPRPGVRQSLAILLAMVVIFGIGLAATLYLYRYPAVFILLITLALYLNFYMAASGVSKLITLLWTLAVLIFPLLGGAQPMMALLVAEGLLKSALAALLCTQLAHTLVPGGARTPAITAAADSHPMQSAWLSTAVVLPAAMVSLTFGLTGAVLPLIMIAVLSQKPDFSVGAAGGKALIAANLAGGVTAVLFYQLLSVSPTYPFLVAGLFALALMFGRRLFSDRPTAPLYATAFSTVLILIGSGTGQFGNETDAAFYKRIALITLSVCYVVGALSLLQMPAVRERWLEAGRWLSGKLARA